MPRPREHHMDTHEFEAQLRRDGYLDIKTKSLDPAIDTRPHSHPFDTRLLVLEGEATITCGEQERLYRPGDVMEIERGVEHFEQYGSARFGFVVGLRHPDTGQPADDRGGRAAPTR